ncbi:MAG: tyrosine-type recombinase/integrase [Afipia sp.]
MSNIKRRSEPHNSRSVLTHRAVEALKPTAEAFRVPDLRCPGLALRVAPGGLKTWEVAFRIRSANKVRRKSLGPFPAVGLDAARDRATAIRRAAQAGRDLLQEEADAKAAAEARVTIDELIREYIKRACGRLRTRHEIELRLKRALETVKDRPAEDIRRRDLRVILNAVADRGVPREAEKQRQSMGAMFSWAVAQDYMDENPTRGLKSLSSSRPRDRVLSADELRVLWAWLSDCDMTQDMVDALKLQICFGARIGETAGIEVCEVDQMNWVWTLPANRSKNKKLRVTPVVGLARDILIKRLETKRNGALFINETRRALRSNDIGSAIVTRRKRMPIPHFVSHDLRRTVATGLVDLGVNYELVAAILGHEMADKSTRILTRHYVRTDLVERKRVALEAWDRRLREIIEGKMASTNIVNLSDITKEAI